MEYYLAIKKNKSLTRVTTWMHIENSTPSERSQIQKATCHTTSSIHAKCPESIAREDGKLSGCQGLGNRERGRGHLMGARSSFGVMTIF